MLYRLIFLSALVGTLSAQVTGRLSGTVLDSSGSAVPGATVTLLLAGSNAPVLATTTTAQGLFHLTGVPPSHYDLVVEAKGFSKYLLRQVQVEPARETSLLPVELGVAPVTEVVEVTSGGQAVQTSNAEIATTVTNQQVRRLPLLDRAPLFLIGTQPGVSFNGRTIAVINGQRTSFSNLTLDGIDIELTFFRSSLNFSSNNPLLDQVAEFTISTSNTDATVGGASPIALVTPSGTNQYHGSAYWSNRNNALSANTWFNNRDGLNRPFLNRNQAGGSFGGPIRRNKLLFYGNYEGARIRQQVASNRTILTEDARRSISTYQDLEGNVRKVDILSAAGVAMDPGIQQILSLVPGPEKINNFRVGDSRESLLRNTAGYSFLRRNNQTSDNVTAKLDYLRSTRHLFSGSLLWNRLLGDNPGDEGYSPVPKNFSNNRNTLLSLAWRWSPGPRWTNELRGGFNHQQVIFDTSEKFGPYILNGAIFSNPQETARKNGHDPDTYKYMDNAGYVHGKHSLQFGSQVQQTRVSPFDELGNLPTYSLGIGTGNPGLSGSQLPGIRAADLFSANEGLLATLAGYVTAYSQGFNVTSRTSGFVDGAPYRRHFSLNNYAFYVQDGWKALPRLALTAGLRYDYYSVVDERDSLALLPRIENRNPISTILSNATLDFAGSSVGRPGYRKDKNNFAPNVGLAWDLFGNGRTALRAAYTVHYVNDANLFALDQNTQNFNNGLRGFASRVELSGRISTGLPRVEKPAFQVPRTLQDNFRLSPTGAVLMPDPGLVTPYVQQWNVGIQQAFKGIVIEARYVGNHGTKLFRGIDYNQVVIRDNGFLEDFQRALNNGNLARQATGAFNPNFNPAIPGSQRLTVFPLLVGGGLLNQAFVRSLIEQGQAGQLAVLYQANGLNGPLSFFPNPFAVGGAYLVTNYSNSTYNGLQVEARRRTRGPLQFQASYTYSKVLSDSQGIFVNRLERFLDLNNPKVERARAAFDLTHAIKANAVWDLPLGEGHRIHFRGVPQLLTGWAITGIMTWQSGAPFSILSGRATLNRFGGTANAILSKSQLDSLLGFRQTGSGPYFVAPSAIGSDGRGVAPDGTAPFEGQVFFHPAAGTIGTLQQRMFSGPWTFNLDFAVLKNTKISERKSVELRMEAFNVFNHPTWGIDDQFISSPGFGRIVRTFYDRRLIQFGLRFQF